MNALEAAIRELIGLFVDDGWFALRIVAVVVLAGISATLMPAAPWAAGAILLFGCIGTLITSVMRSARRRNANIRCCIADVSASGSDG